MESNFRVGHTTDFPVVQERLNGREPFGGSFRLVELRQVYIGKDFRVRG